MNGILKSASLNLLRDIFGVGVAVAGWAAFYVAVFGPQA